MIKQFIFASAILLICFLAACKSSINADDLYGKWKYIKVENPRATPPDSISHDELIQQAPYIQFSKNNPKQVSFPVLINEVLH